MIKLCVNNIVFVLWMSCLVSSEKRILLWTDFFGSPDWYLPRWEQMYQNTCNYTCSIVTSSSREEPASSYDAILFHSRALPSTKLPPEKERKKGQVYVFFYLESPSNSPEDLTNYKGYFNWTMTYRNDSDVRIVYNSADKIKSSDQTDKTVQQLNKRHMIADVEKEKPEKTHLVSWIVSNCGAVSKRDEFVSELKKYLPVYQKGKCISSGDCDQNCYEDTLTSSKFYLSLENSHCQDYITEKFWAPLRSGSVPIVPGDVGYAKVAPPGSYIRTKDFGSVADLADYLRLLNNNDTLYKQYNSWRKTYQVTSGGINWAQAMCNLCAKLHNDHGKTKIYDDINSWWRDNMCSSSFSIQESYLGLETKEDKLVHESGPQPLPEEDNNKQYKSKQDIFPSSNHTMIIFSFVTLVSFLIWINFIRLCKNFSSVKYKKLQIST